MRMPPIQCLTLAATAFALGFAQPIAAADIGQIKIAKGSVTVGRGTETRPAAVGTRLQTSDVVTTGADGSVGISMTDDSLLSLGPNSTLSLDRYEFDSTTNQGAFGTTLQKGSLAVVSGRIAKQTPDAVAVRTPHAVLGVRGTEFVVSAGDAMPSTR